ncbi:hypothetical protein [Streptomyces sp. NPDC127092]|uniref:hypothetical protein n=1 Tax=Streptomyces sp. NPDC127092 TaxID=3347135 RepID=UPI00365AA97B
MNTQGDEGQLQIYETEENGPGWTRCVVRCVGGVVRRGDRLDGGRLTVDRIDAYMKVDVDFVDAAHAARVLLSGPGVSGLRRSLVIGTAGPRLYGYTGPPEIRRAVGWDHPGGPVIGAAADFAAWAAVQSAADLAEPFTYVVDARGRLRLAPRRSEHVACAGGGCVRAAGEITWEPSPAGGWSAAEVNNFSTGYAPDPECWPSVAAALETAGLGHPGRFTHAVTFRRCPAPDCAQLNVVRDGLYVCAVCGATLPAEWNAAAE